MKNTTGTIWVDFTDMLLWSGHLTGTQRVTYELGLRLYNQHANVAFFVYDEKSRNFYPVPFEKIKQTVEASLVPPTDSPAVSEETNRPATVKGMVKGQLIRVYQSVPYKVRRRITPEHKALLKKIHHAASSRIRPKSSSLKKLMDTSNPIQFLEQDQVVILGKPWDTMTFIEVLREQKLENNFKLTHLIYDMVPVFLPHVFGYPLPQNYTTYMFEAISLADQLIAISESTKKDIQRFCEEERLPTPSISVVRIGDLLPSASLEQEIDSPKLKGLTPEKYILCVGTIEIRKNHILLYTAYKEAELRGIDLPKLVIAGSIFFNAEDVMQEFKNDPGLTDKVTVIEKPTDLELGWLYRNCLFTVYPSVYEGWGLPIAESLAYGKVSVASSTSSMPEVGGDLVDYFSPYDSVGCMNVIQRYSDPTVLKKREAKIKATYKPTSWDQAYQSIDHLF